MKKKKKSSKKRGKLKSEKRKRKKGVKISKKELTKKKTKKEILVGRVTHYFDKIKVAAIKLTSSLSLGDKIRIVGGKETDFKQTVKSMELNKNKIKRGKKGQEIAIKVKEKAREGYKVYKIS